MGTINGNNALIAAGQGVSGKEMWPQAGQTLKEKNGKYIGGIGDSPDQRFENIYINPKGELILVPVVGIPSKRIPASNEFTIEPVNNENKVVITGKGMSLDGYSADMTDHVISNFNKNLEKNPDSNIEKIERVGDLIVIHTKKDDFGVVCKEYRDPAKIGIKFTNDI